MIKKIFLASIVIFLAVLGEAAVSQSGKRPEKAKETMVVNERCLITIDGKKYDVTEFRKEHKGGDIFKCGTDMSADFHRQHDGKKLMEAEKYLVK